MKFYTFFSLGLALFCTLSVSNAQELSTKQEVLKQMVLGNTYFMDKWPDPGLDIVTDKTRPSNLWTRAAYYEGLMALYRLNLDPALYTYAVDWGESHDWNPTYGNLTTVDGDHQCCGQTYIELYQISGNSSWIEPITITINNMVNSEKSDAWSWIDAIQMSMPVFAKLGAVLEDTSYFQKMYELYSHSRNIHGDAGLYNQEDHLWWRDGNFDPPHTSPNGLNVYWSRGNGWVFTALARVLEVIPEDENHRATYLQDFVDMAGALAAIQREDGFWNSNLADPDDFGGKETSGTGFFVYGLAWGINHGILDSATYMPHVVRGWEGLVKDALHETGFLGWVQSTGKEPKDGQPLAWDKVPNFEDYGLGAFLLAGSEVWKLAKEGPVTSAPYLRDHPVQCGQLEVYPNPASDQVYLRYTTQDASPCTLSIFNMKGNKVYSREIQGSESGRVLEVLLDPQGKVGHTFPAGVYLVRLDSGEQSLTGKLIL